MKILVVDDERMICEWFEHCIQNNPGCELASCAHNGGQVLALFKQTDAGVVFTDTKMPVMGGLELLKKIKELASKTAVVMLTAFAEFDLVREVTHLGGDDYLTKTETNNQTFREVLKRPEQRISENGNRSGMEVESTGQQRSIISDILKGNRTLKEGDIRKLGDCHIRWRDDGLFAVAVWKQELLQGFTLPENSMIHHMTGPEYDSRTYAMTGNLVWNPSELKKIQLLHDYVTSIGAKNRCMVGVSTTTDNLSHVTTVVEEVVCGLNCGHYSGKVKAWGTPVRGGKIQETHEQWREYYRRQRRELYELDGYTFYQKLEEVMDKSEEEESILVPELLALCCDAMEMVHVRFGHGDVELMYRTMADLKTEAFQSTCLQEVKEKILDLTRNILSYQNVDESKLSKGVAVAMDYIRKHYSEAISSKQVFQEAHLNSGYLPHIFKEEVGCAYSAFPSETRLKKAAHLLSHISERVQKIAEQVGYPSVSYFSTTFKKRHGVNPCGYRRGEQNMRTIMVMYDSLNRNMLEFYGGGLAATPNSSRLAEWSVTFDNCYAGSLPCTPARREPRTGRYNSIHRSQGPLEPLDDSMPEIPNHHGVHPHLATDHYHCFEDGGATYHTRYRTWEGFRGQEGDAWKGVVDYREQLPAYENRCGGVDDSWEHNWMPQDLINRTYMGGERLQPQSQTSDAGKELIETNYKTNQWFLQIGTSDPHEPFFSQERFQKLVPHHYEGAIYDWPDYRKVDDKGIPEIIRYLRCEYAALLAMCDKKLDEILDLMDRYDMWKDTMLIANTDHGFLFSEHGQRAKYHCPFYSEAAEIPLFIWDPMNQERGKHVKSLMQTVDLSVTILEQFDIERPEHMERTPLQGVIKEDKPVREAAFFGIFGGQMNCTDGRYVYMKSPVCQEQEIYQYMPIPTHYSGCRAFIPPEELGKMMLTEGFPFTKGLSLMRIPCGQLPAQTGYETMLFDLEQDLCQERSCQDEKAGTRMEVLTKFRMIENECPEELLIRYGFQDGDVKI